MRAFLDIRPRKITARTKADIKAKIAQMGVLWTVGIESRKEGSKLHYCAYRETRGDENFVLVNFEKIRSKRKDSPTGGHKVRVREARWDAWVYVVPARLVTSAVQHDRNFTLRVG